MDYWGKVKVRKWQRSKTKTKGILVPNQALHNEAVWGLAIHLSAFLDLELGRAEY
jgi:hypothetical protein